MRSAIVKANDDTRVREIRRQGGRENIWCPFGFGAAGRDGQGGVENAVRSAGQQRREAGIVPEAQEPELDCPVDMRLVREQVTGVGKRGNGRL